MTELPAELVAFIAWSTIFTWKTTDKLADGYSYLNWQTFLKKNEVSLSLQEKQLTVFFAMEKI